MIYRKSLLPFIDKKITFIYNTLFEIQHHFIDLNSKLHIKHSALLDVFSQLHLITGTACDAMIYFQLFNPMDKKTYVLPIASHNNARNCCFYIF